MPQRRDDYHLSLLSLAIKLGVILVAFISCSKLAAAHQRTRTLYGELKAEYERQQGNLLMTRRSFDELFQIDPGESPGQWQAGQWTAPHRQRVVWESSGAPASPNLESP